MSIVHVYLTHLPAVLTQRLLEIMGAVWPGIDRVLAYGGSFEEFQNISFPNKFHLVDRSLSGPVWDQCFNELIYGLWRCLERKACEFDYVHCTEYDHIFLSPNYFDLLADALRMADCDFVGKACGVKPNSNWPHYLRYRNDTELLGFLDSISVREDKTVICGCLGNGFTISRDALKAAASVPNLPRVYIEVLFPTLSHHLGFRLADLGEKSDLFRYVRSGPQWFENEIRQLRESGVVCAHPFKNPSRLGIVQEEFLYRSGR